MRAIPGAEIPSAIFSLVRAIPGAAIPSVIFFLAQ
jgi:hypothetical protein